MQGSAGSGKTTIGLHRIAYLAFAEPRRFRPEKMLVVVYQRALAAYVSRVLPSLDVEGVPVMTFAGWAESVRKMAVPLLQAPLTDETPSLVMRAKSHGAMLRILADRQAALARFCRERLGARPGRQAGRADAAGGLGRDAAAVDERASRRWRSGCATPPLDPATRNAVEGAGARCARARAT